MNEQPELRDRRRAFRCCVCGRPIVPGGAVRMAGVQVWRQPWPYRGPGRVLRTSCRRWPARLHPWCAGGGAVQSPAGWERLP